GCGPEAQRAPGGWPPPPAAGGGSAERPVPPRTPALPRPKARSAAAPGCWPAALPRSLLALRPRWGRNRRLQHSGKGMAAEEPVAVPAPEHPLHVAARLGEGNLLHPAVELGLRARGAPATHRVLPRIVARQC